MPSGAKKRKAAKKKKEQETHHGKSSSNHNDNPQGNNDVSSDGGETGSTAYQEHPNHQDQLNKRNEELEERGAPSVRPNASEDKSTKGVPSDVEADQKVGVENDGVVRIERELKEDSASKNLNTKDAKSAKGSYNGDDSSSSSSSSSSSDDESQVVDRRRKEDAYASVSDKKPHSDSVKAVVSSPPEVIQTTEYAPAGKNTSSVTEKAPLVDSVKHEVSVHLTKSTPLESPVISNDVVKTGLENGGEKVLPTGTPVTLTDPVSKKIDESASLLQNETTKASSSLVESVSKGNESEVLPSLGTSLPQVSNDAESIKDPEIPEYSEKQPLVTPDPPVVQKTSWFSCCGILDVITGSNR